MDGKVDVSEGVVPERDFQMRADEPDVHDAICAKSLVLVIKESEHLRVVGG